MVEGGGGERGLAGAWFAEGRRHWGGRRRRREGHRWESLLRVTLLCVENEWMEAEGREGIGGEAALWRGVGEDTRQRAAIA